MPVNPGLPARNHSCQEHTEATVIHMVGRGLGQDEYVPESDTFMWDGCSYRATCKYMAWRTDKSVHGEHLRLRQLGEMGYRPITARSRVEMLGSIHGLFRKREILSADLECGRNGRSIHCTYACRDGPIDMVTAWRNLMWFEI